jgi:hypothetical protein
MAGGTYAGCQQSKHHHQNNGHRGEKVHRSVLFVNPIGKELVVEAVGAARVSTREFAGLLRSYEHTLSADPPDRVVLADDSDAALAAAIVASKLLIPLASRVNASDAANPNGALIARLACA